MKIQILISLITLLTSCAGYRLQQKSNPFAQYSIRSLSIPMFYNKSNLGNISGPFTKEIYKTLTEFNDLRLHTGNGNTDAVLIGVLETSDKYRDTVMTENSTTAKQSFGRDVLGNQREDFIVPIRNSVMMDLRIIVIKHPTPEEIKFLQSDLGEKALSSKIIFNEKIALGTSYLLQNFSDEAVSVLNTHNRGIMKQTVDNLAKRAAINFRNMILYAF